MAKLDPCPKCGKLMGTMRFNAEGYQEGLVCIECEEKEQSAADAEDVALFRTFNSSEFLYLRSIAHYGQMRYTHEKRHAFESLMSRDVPLVRSHIDADGLSVMVLTERGKRLMGVK